MKINNLPIKIKTFKAGGQTRTPDRLITKQQFHYLAVYLLGFFRAFYRVPTTERASGDVPPQNWYGLLCCQVSLKQV
jgi:hypothetical protein